MIWMIWMIGLLVVFGVLLAYRPGRIGAMKAVCLGLVGVVFAVLLEYWPR